MNMYAMQKDLPKLPLPMLEDTCAKLLEWSSPFLSEEAYAASRKAVETFQSDQGKGPFLQKRLEALRDRKDTLNWLEPFWYDAYLANRLPLPINSNVAFVLKKNPETLNLSLSEFAAGLVLSLFEYSKLLSEEALEIDFQGKTPLCMSQYKTLLGTARIPGTARDALSTEQDPRHVAILSNGNCYTLHPLDENGHLMDFNTLVAGVDRILDASAEPGPRPIGNLTAIDRASWAENRKLLMEINPENIASLKAVEQALALIVLDRNAYASESDMFKTMLCGDPDNRWYDKSLQFIVKSGPTYAVNYEHSGVDGTTLGNLARYLYKNMRPRPAGKATDAPGLARKIPFSTTPRIDAEIAKARAESLQAFHDLSVEILIFEDFGKNRIKALKTSPDSFIQIAMQLAQHKTFGKVDNAYEAVMTKQFLHGRTEAMRPITKESLKFIETRSKADLMEAAKKHIERILECKNGYGIDRHLFGLMKMHEQHFPGEALPDLFLSPGYKSITRNFFSTSTSNPLGLMHAGYGPVIKDGYALRYLIYGDELHFLLSSMSHNAGTLVKLKENLAEALKEMASILEE